MKRCLLLSGGLDSAVCGEAMTRCEREEPNVLVLDEALQHLDGEGRERVASVVRNINRESVFLVSHDQTVGGNFDAVDTVVLSDRNACLESVG